MTGVRGLRPRRVKGSALAILLLASVASYPVLDRLYPPNLTRLAQQGTEFTARDGRTLAMLPAPGGIWRFPLTPAQVSPAFLDLLIRTEDHRFYHHPGVDPVAVLRAAAQWIRAGHVVSGGSTLSMQVARLLEPRPRTLRSKLIEAFRSIQLERRLGKDGILAAWLTLAPYGGNLEGLRAGALAWCGAEPATLDQAQSALLVAIPRRPEALRPDRHPTQARLLRDRLLPPDLRSEPLLTARTRFPTHALAALRPLRANPSPIATTIDLPLQIALERLLADRQRTLPPRAALAALAVDLSTRDIRAVVSSTTTLDLTQAWRSPGSALKPFIYGLAFQDGLVAPGTPLADRPRHFGHYAPENFDRSFTGSVTAAEALQRSLNLPAVALLDQIGPLRFATWLAAAGAPPKLPPGAAPSLPLALGGAALQLRTLTRLYAALATDGTSRPLRLRPSVSPTSDRPLLQASAATLVADTLTRDFPDGGPPGIAWKTGTSWGGRDAWALGFDTRMAVGLWLGRPDNTALPGVTGAGTALPILAQSFALLPPNPRPTPPEPAPPPTVSTAAPSTSLHLLFPPQNAILSADGPVPIRIMGGRRPLVFLVDGHPIPSPQAARTATWLPPTPGFYTLTVEDADGDVIHTQVRIR